MKRRLLGFTAIGLAAILATALPGATQPAHAAGALVDPIVTPVSGYAIDVPSSVLVAATAGVSTGGLTSGQLAAMLANSERFNPDWVTTDVGQLMSGTTTTSPPDIADLSPEELAQFEELVAGFGGAPATKLATFAKVVGGKAVPVAGAVLTGIQLGADLDRGVGIDVDGSLCAGAPNFGFQVANAVLAALTSADCDSWNKSQELADAPNRDTAPTVTPTAIGSTSCVGSYCATITALSRIGTSSTYDYCIVWNTPTSTQGVVPTGQYAVLGGWVGGADYETTALTAADGPYWNVVQVCPAPPAGSHVSMIGAQNGGTQWQYPLTAWRATEWSSSSTATVSPPIVTYPDPARTIRCDITLSTGHVLSASTPTFREGDANIPSPVYPAIPSGAVPTNTKCVETGGPQTPTLSQATTTAPYQSWMTHDKECGNGSCLLDLRQNGVSCFFTNADCEGWMTDPNRDSTYQCYIGTHAVAISECYIYGTTFNAEDRANGHAYADPATGSAVDGQTSQSDTDVIEAALLAKDWVGTADFPLVDESNKPTLAAAIAAACVLQLDQEPDILIIKTCSETPIYSPGIDVAQAAGHDATAIVTGQPFLLHYETGAQKEAGGLPSGWYGSPATNCSGEYRPQTDPLPTNCDEYPFYTTVESGPGASLANIAATDNVTQGRQLWQFYSGCNLIGSAVASESNQYLVVPIPGSPSVGICGIG